MTSHIPTDGRAPQGGMQPANTGFAPQPPTGAGGLAIAALVVGIGAFLTGWLSFVSIPLGITGIVLGILAIRRPRGRGLGITGLILSALGFLTGVVVSVLVLLSIPFASIVGGAVDSADGRKPAPHSSVPGVSAEPFDEARFSVVNGQPISTPCWSYDGPRYFTNNISPDAAGACFGELQLWGEDKGGGEVTPSGVGAIQGQIGVEPVRVSTAESLSPGTNITAMVDALADTYFVEQAGVVDSLHEEITLDGVPANLTRMTSDSETTRTKAFITAYAPAPYDIAGEPAQLFVISLVTPYSNGEEQIQQVLDSWRWN